MIAISLSQSFDDQQSDELKDSTKNLETTLAKFKQLQDLTGEWQTVLNEATTLWTTTLESYDAKLEHIKSTLTQYTTLSDSIAKLEASSLAMLSLSVVYWVRVDLICSNLAS